DDDGYMFIVDRVTDMIVTGGENVYSKEVEDALAAHPSVVEAAVVGRPDPAWGETVAAFVVPEEGRQIDANELTAFLADKLAKNKIPRTFAIVPELPHTPSGKVAKFTLRESLAADAE
ncbi:MAG: fatty-acid--CoA ligase, partial [Propionibacteriales bacterium]|nr:fatty-acid--CoA ligase [Propionibacteriales bacterium]